MDRLRHACTLADPPPVASLSEVLGGLSYALDLTEGQRPGHSARACAIGMRLADTLGLPAGEQGALFYALLMKDLGCSSNAARFAALFGSSDHDLKADLKNIDWSRAMESFRFVLRNAAPGQSLLQRTWRVFGILSRGPEGAREVVRTRCERGADIARLLELEESTVQGIRSLDEHWDGQGQPYSLEGQQIPVVARILNLAQTVEVFWSQHGEQTAFDMATARSGTWFDPEMVRAFRSLERDRPFWSRLRSEEALGAAMAAEPGDRRLAVTDDRLDRIALAFAQVIDAKSPWTYDHSVGVATGAVAIARTFGYSNDQLRELRRAALLHDVGKLGVSSLILDKPGRLTDGELASMRTHTTHTYEILRRVSCFQSLVGDAAAHHERIDGAGYHTGRSAADLGQPARILAVADIYDALRASRPYRDGLPLDRIVDILRREAGTGLDPVCVDAMCTLATEAAAGDAPQAPPIKLVGSLDEDYSQAA